MSLPMRVPAIARQGIPTDNLLYRYDASIDTLNATYPNNAILPNHTGGAFAFKSVIVDAVSAPIVTTKNSKHALKQFQGDFLYSMAYITATTRITPETVPLTFAVVFSQDGSSGSAAMMNYDSGNGGVVRRMTATQKRVELSRYSGTSSFYNLADTTALEVFLVELPANNETEPKTFRLYRNGVEIITVTDSADYVYSTGNNFSILCFQNYNYSFLHDFLFWDRKLTAQEKTDVAANLMTKWGIV